MRVFLLVLAVAQVGCGKRPRDDEEAPSSTYSPTKPLASCELGPIKASVERAFVGKIERRKNNKNGDRFETADPHFTIFVRFENTSETRKFEFNQFRFGRGRPRATDELNNDYREETLPIGDIKSMTGFTTIGESEKSDLYPRGEPLTKVFAFQVPVKAAQVFKVTIPGAYLEQEGDFTFNIPSSAWRK